MPSTGGLMETSPGGEQTQYEGINTFQKPHAKEAGQLGDPTTYTTIASKDDLSSNKNAPNTQGITPADKIRYGQSIQEGGMGGETDSSTGEARTEGGFGGTKKVEEGEDESASKERRKMGYGGKGEKGDVSAGVGG
ncbi:hypothetical protein BCR34DRAFT_483982 [Clohesyomyces aquaticus]|uniref:Uncharacterized protein n=1 Tax=Clohesyomyces aquaticus TaxID=1231657 RepID=A0A1Y1ZN30_9PLEO|nr:hypothetical protein BCR34DRAFT_483982 [Clohesyomyces aquaticus]